MESTALLLYLGVCDCCDGADEQDNPFETKCDNICDEVQFHKKREALISYNLVRQGLQAKNDMILSMNKKKSRESDDYVSSGGGTGTRPVYKSYKKEIKEINQIILLLRLKLAEEEMEESSLRYDYIRERSRRCADGVNEMCDIFHEKGINPYISSPHNARAEEGKPFNFETMYKNTIKSLNFHPPKVDLLYKSTCPINNTLVNLYTYERKTLGEYLKASAKPRKSRKAHLSREQARRRTLIVPYLEGPEGAVPALQWIVETVGLVCLPVLVPVYAFISIYNYLYSKISDNIRYCSKGHTIGGYTSTLFSTLQEDQESRERQQQQDLENNDCPFYLQHFSVFVLRTQTDDTFILFKILSYLNPYNYTFFYNIVNFFKPYEKQYRWYSRLLYKSPITYYKYYFTSLVSTHIPPLRESCQIRQGIEIAYELLRIYKDFEKKREEALLEEEKERQRRRSELLGDTDRRKDGGRKPRVGNLHLNRGKMGGGVVKSSPGSKGKDPDMVPNFEYRRNKLMSEVMDSAEGLIVDYGSDYEWESLADTCVERPEKEYIYKLCFFKDVFQGTTLLGECLSETGVNQERCL